MGRILLAASGMFLVAGALLGGAARAEEETARERILALRATGGREAAVELAEILAEEGEEEIRVAALEALAHVGLRCREVAAPVREAARSPDVATRVAALRALGRIGDGSDVPHVLEGLRSEEGKIRSAALAALGVLSGRRLPASPTRCTQWWIQNEPRSREALAGALDALTADVGDARAAASHRATIAREGWVAPDRVAVAARTWLSSPDHRLRAEAFHAVGVLRLADLAEAVEHARRFADEVDGPAAEFAARTLGLTVEATEDRTP